MKYNYPIVELNCFYCVSQHKHRETMVNPLTSSFLVFSQRETTNSKAQREFAHRKKCKKTLNYCCKQERIKSDTKGF